MTSVGSRARIASVTVTPILIADAPLLNMQGVHQPYTPRAIIEVVTVDGTLGLGETYGDADVLAMLELFATHLPGESVLAPNRLWQLAADILHGGTAPRNLVDNEPGHNLFGDNSVRKLRSTVVSAFEVAFLDATGHLLGVPVHALLGGKVRDRVDFAAYLFYKWEHHPQVNAPVDDWGAVLDPAGVVRLASRMIDRYGFRSLKLKGGVFPPDQEIAAIEALHQAFPGIPLRLDPNAAWSAETGIRVAEALRGKIEYLEDPCAGRPEMAEVHAAAGVPLATNMCVTDFDEIPEAIALGSIQVLLTDHHYWGGLRATQNLAALCNTFGLSVSMHSNSHLGISLAAMVHAAACAEGDFHACDTHRPWQTEDVITHPHEIVDGAIEVSDAPGLGVELDRFELERLHRRWIESDVRDRDDVRAMQVRDPSFVKRPIPYW